MTALEILDRAVESATGEPVEVLRNRSLEEGRRLAEQRHGAPMRFESAMTGLIAHETVEEELDRALESL